MVFQKLGINIDKKYGITIDSLMENPDFIYKL